MKLAIQHTQDPTITYTFRKATTAEFAAYWNMMATRGGSSMLIAQSNLTIAVRETPDEKTFAELLDAEWSALPTTAAGLIATASGFFPLVDEFDAKDLDNETKKECGAKLDLRNLDKHVDPMVVLGMTDAKLIDWIGKRNTALTRVAIALPESIGGYYIGRVPSLSIRTAAQRIQNASASDDEHGAFDALCRIFLDCCLWCAPLSTAQMIEQYPGAVVKIAMEVRDLGNESFVLEHAKSNP